MGKNDYEAARKCASDIMRYWHKKGHFKVRAWVERADESPWHYAVKSNIAFLPLST